LYNVISSPMRPTCSTHLIRLDLIYLMILGNEYEAPHFIHSNNCYTCSQAAVFNCTGFHRRVSHVSYH
jgi:hypothetical protein